MSDLIDCQRVVERMLANHRILAEVEEYIERCALDETGKAGLWMLAWANQDQPTQLRVAKETLALASSMRSPPELGRAEAPAAWFTSIGSNHNHGVQLLARSAELARQQARERALEVSSVMSHTAQTLDHTATLAEEHADRHQRTGDHEAAAKERRAAVSAREAAQQARAYATYWQPEQVSGQGSKS